MGGQQLHGSGVGKMVLHVVARAVQALLLLAPQGNANRAAGLYAGRFQDAHGFHHHGAAGRVISSAGGSMPGVQMPPKHYHFAFQLAVGAGNFGYYIVAFQIGVLETGFGRAAASW